MSKYPFPMSLVEDAVEAGPDVVVFDDVEPMSCQCEGCYSCSGPCECEAEAHDALWLRGSRPFSRVFCEACGELALEEGEWTDELDYDSDDGESW